MCYNEISKKPNGIKPIFNQAYDTHFYECPPLIKLQNHHPSSPVEG